MSLDLAIDDVCRELGTRDNAISAGTVDLARLVPREPGLYSWWVDDLGREQLSEGAEVVLPALIYAGQAGATSLHSRKESAATLRSRIVSNHLGGQIGTSTFRRTLSALLREILMLRVASTRRLEIDSNATLTEWIHTHLSVCWVPYTDRVSLEPAEAAMLNTLDPPLNLQGMPATAMRLRVRMLRHQLGRDSESP